MVYIQLLKYLDNNFIPVMPHERELRQVNDINYKIVEDVGKTDESRLKEQTENGKFRRKYYPKEERIERR